MKTRPLRYASALVVLGMVCFLAFGYGRRSFEAWCPFGGMESLWGLLRDGEFSCALGPLNLSMLVALLGLAVVAKKAFCGWACPIGFLGELAARLGGRAWRRRPRVAPNLDRWLKPLRYAVLVGFLFLTYRTGELVLRGYDPFYLIFSGVGHGSAGAVSWVVLGALLAAALVLPMAFCRYLCPLGAVFDPFSRLGLLRLHRDANRCTACGQCARACPQRLPVNELAQLRHKDCTNCLECVDACAEPGVLQLRAGL